MCGFAAAFGWSAAAKSSSVQINFVNNERLAASSSTTLRNPGSRVQSLSRLTLEKRGKNLHAEIDFNSQGYKLVIYILKKLQCGKIIAAYYFWLSTKDIILKLYYLVKEKYAS